MKTSTPLLALLALLLAGALVSGAETGWSQKFTLDTITPGTAFQLQTTDPIAASTLWVDGSARTAKVTATAAGVSDYEVVSLTEGQEQCQPWDYSAVPSGTLPRDKEYTLTHEIKDNDTTKDTLSATATLLPEPCLAFVLSLLGLAIFGRRARKAAFTLAAVAALSASAVTVTDVKCQQRWPWNGKVDIDYTLSGDEEIPNFVMSFAGQYGDQSDFALTTLEGAGVGAAINAFGTYRTTWDAGIDKPGINVSDIKVAVTATFESIEPQPGGYMKVDLDTGVVTTQENAPDNWNEEDGGVKIHKSKYLWLRKITAGTFKMGSSTESNNKPHNVTLTKDFYIGVFPLTRDQYNKIGGAHNDYANPTGDGIYPVNKFSFYDLRGTNTATQFDWPRDGHEVASFSAMGKLRKKVSDAMHANYLFDLPTEAQWECACRAGHYGAVWNDGSAENIVDAHDSAFDNLAWYAKNPSVGNPKISHEVGTLNPSSWGFYDMHGNLYEWCLDWKGDLTATAVTDPVGPDSGSNRIRRGGNFDATIFYCRSASRNSNSLASRSYSSGVRVALECN